MIVIKLIAAVALGALWITGLVLAVVTIVDLTKTFKK